MQSGSSTPASPAPVAPALLPVLLPVVVAVVVEVSLELMALESWPLGSFCVSSTCSYTKDIQIREWCSHVKTNIFWKGGIVHVAHLWARTWTHHQQSLWRMASVTPDLPLPACQRRQPPTATVFQHPHTCATTYQYMSGRSSFCCCRTETMEQTPSRTATTWPLPWALKTHLFCCWLRSLVTFCFMESCINLLTYLL